MIVGMLISCYLATVYVSGLHVFSILNMKALPFDYIMFVCSPLTVPFYWFAKLILFLGE